jgi:hypothetical protein
LVDHSFSALEPAAIPALVRWQSAASRSGGFSCPISIRVLDDNEFGVKKSGGTRGPVLHRVLNWRMTIFETSNDDSRAVAGGGELS